MAASLPFLFVSCLLASGIQYKDPGHRRQNCSHVLRLSKKKMKRRKIHRVQKVSFCSKWSAGQTKWDQSMDPFFEYSAELLRCTLGPISASDRSGGGVMELQNPYSWRAERKHEMKTNPFSTWLCVYVPSHLESARLYFMNRCELCPYSVPLASLWNASVEPKTRNVAWVGESKCQRYQKLTCV